MHIIRPFDGESMQECYLSATNKIKLESNTANIVNMPKWNGIEVLSLEGSYTQI